MVNLKDDSGKPRLSLVPPEMIAQAARVMDYGEKKYGSNGTWRDRANTQQYIDALARHTTAFWADPEGVDDESGLPHLSHVAANVAYLCDLMYGKPKKEDGRRLLMHDSYYALFDEVVKEKREEKRKEPKIVKESDFTYFISETKAVQGDVHWAVFADGEKFATIIEGKPYYTVKFASSARSIAVFETFNAAYEFIVRVHRSERGSMK